jgi:hypothetical protein
LGLRFNHGGADEGKILAPLFSLIPFISFPFACVCSPKVGESEGERGGEGKPCTARGDGLDRYPAFVLRF